MGLPIQIPGLDVFIPEVPDRRVVLVEGGMDPAKNHFARVVARSAAAAGRQVTYVTSREREDAERRLQEGGPCPDGLDVVALEDWNEVGLPHAGTADIFVDAFSLFALQMDAKELARELRALRGYCHRSARSAVLVLERGLLDARSMALLAHFADGILQFHLREGTDGVQQFLRIPKWTSGEVFTDNVYYDFDGRRMLIDTRRRVG